MKSENQEEENVMLAQLPPKGKDNTYGTHLLLKKREVYIYMVGGFLLASLYALSLLTELTITTMGALLTSTFDLCTILFLEI